MQFVGKVITSVSEFYKDINPSTLSGAIDVLVVEDVKTGQQSCSPFHVRFGKLQLLRPQEKIVEMRINGEISSIKMKVGEAGETFFVLPSKGAVPAEYLTSPLVTFLPDNHNNSNNGRIVEPLSLSPVKKISSLTQKSIDSDGEDILINNSDNGRMNNSDARNATSDTEVTNAEMMVENSALERRAVQSDGETELLATHNRSITAGSPPKYSWMWGGLPRKKDTDIDVDTSQTATIDDTTATTATTTMPPLPSITNDFVDIFEYFDQPNVFKTNYDMLFEEDKKLDNNILIFKMEKTTTSDLFLPRGLNIEKEPESTNEILAMIEAKMEQLDWKRVEEDSDFLTSELIMPTNDSKILFVIDSKMFFTGSVGFTLIMGKSLFGKFISYETILKKFPNLKPSTIIKEEEEEKETHQEVTFPTEGSTSSSPPIPIIEKSVTTAKIEKDLSEGRRSSWRFWSRSPPTRSTNDKVQSSAEDTTATTITKTTTTTTTTTLLGSRTSTTISPSGTPLKDQTTFLPLSDLAAAIPLPPSPSSLPLDTTSSAIGIIDDEQIYYTKSLRLPHEMLLQLNLQPGVNTVSFTVTTRLQGTATCNARIFLWKSDARIVISDIDGTITKSDALGHLFAFVGKDWTHSNIANLYTNIANNGYQFIYLSSRSLGQANVTRGYLKGIEQNKFQLPDGPIIMSPDRLLAAFRREVVLGIPQEFKIACLKDLQQLFYNCTPEGMEHVNPFYAGFGNRTNDAHAYLAIGIPPPRIFIINPAGTVTVEPLADQYASSYGQLIQLADSIFPPLSTKTITPIEEPFNEFWYWRRPISLAPLIDADNKNVVVLPINTPTIELLTDNDGEDGDDDDGEEEEGLVPAYYV